MEQSVSIELKQKIIAIRRVIDSEEFNLNAKGNSAQEHQSIQTQLDELYELGCQVSDFIEAIQRATSLIQD